MNIAVNMPVPEADWIEGDAENVEAAQAAIQATAQARGTPVDEPTARIYAVTALSACGQL